MRLRRLHAPEEAFDLAQNDFPFLGCEAVPVPTEWIEHSPDRII